MSPGKWPTPKEVPEFLDMLGDAGTSGRFVCFEYRGRGDLSTEALTGAIKSLVNDHDVLLAIDTEHAVVFAHPSLGSLEAEIREMCADGDLEPLFIALAKVEQGRVGLARISDDGSVQFMPYMVMG